MGSSFRFKEGGIGMINLKTNCEDCIHVKVCKNKDSSKRFLEKLTKVRDDCDYDCENLSYQYNVNVDISCPNFRCSEAIRELRHDM